MIIITFVLMIHACRNYQKYLSNTMYQGLCLALIILPLMSCQLTGSNDTTCKKRGKSIASLNLAKESISKVREFYPNCTEMGKIRNNSKCGTREISFGYLDIAMNLISDSLQNYPTCSDDNGKEKNNKTQLCEEPMDCSQILMNGHNVSGVYTIWLMTGNSTRRSIEVYCDMETAGGGWTVIQRRGNFEVQEDFFRDWATYKRGFGNITKDFWIGNDNLFALTNQASYAIRFDLENNDGVKGHALYRYFRIEDESSGYKLHVDDYSGDVGDSMLYHNNMKFSTKDRKNDKRTSGTSCAIERRGAWWYDNCYYSNLNGFYRRGSKSDKTAVSWFTWRKFECLETVEVKLKKM